MAVLQVLGILFLLCSGKITVSLLRSALDTVQRHLQIDDPL